MCELILDKHAIAHQFHLDVTYLAIALQENNHLYLISFIDHRRRSTGKYTFYIQFVNNK